MTTRKSTDMDNTMRITIPWKPGMAVMLKDGRYVPDGVIDYLADSLEDLKHLAADGHQVEIVNGWVLVNYCQVDGYWFMIDGPEKVRRFHKERWTMDDITERIALEDRDA